MKRIVFTIFVCFFLFVSTGLTQERGAGNRPISNVVVEKRLALVIGNGAYQMTSSLPTSVNDANDMAATLKSLGFAVITGTNLNKRQMMQLIREFGDTLAQQKSIGLFYYAGHAVQVSGRNYLIPVEAEILAEDETEDSGINVDIVLSKMHAATNQANIVILDASRNNPFPSVWRNSDSNGLAQLALPTGTLISYSTAPGNVVAEATGRNSIYTQELIKNLKVPDITIEKVFQQTRVSVAKLTQSKQYPWESSSLIGDIYIAGTQQTAASKPPPIELSAPIQNPQPQKEQISKPKIDEQINPTISISGRYFALVIGINTYQSISRLQMAEVDARVVEATLRENFGFQTKLLLNADANRQKIFDAIEEYRNTLTESDSLLIYYAGHGYFDRETNNAYWLPVDATRNSKANWVSANDITSDLRAILAKHILVVSDSCYSGTLTRQLELESSSPVAGGREKFLQKMLAGKSRNLMASGGNEPVSDSGGGKHSVFANAFLIGLAEMERNAFTASELFQQFVQERVTGNSEQTPEYNPLRNSGHDSGDFVFVRKK